MTSSVLIFIVDDDTTVRELLKDSLEEGGYQVMTASDGAEAMAILDAGSTDFRALITDVNLPPGKVTGWDIAQRGRELNPTLPVVYMTGAGAHEWPSKGVPHSVLLAKPFATAQVVTAVSQLLNEAGSGDAVSAEGRIARLASGNPPTSERD